MSTWRLLLAAVLLSPCPALAARLRVCTDVHPHPPYLMPDGGGSVGRMVAEAAREAGFQIEFYAASLARCRAEARINLVNGYPMTPYLPDVLDYVVYPARLGVPDPSRATVRARVMLFRRSGTAIGWNGVRFEGLSGPALVAAGGVAMNLALTAAHARVDQSGRSLQVNFARMLAGRGDIAAGFEEEGMRLLRLPEFAGKVDVLPVPLFEQAYFMVVTKPYYAQHGPAVERMWDAIGRLNQPAKTQKK